MINIIENTLRDGSYVVDFQFNETHTKDVCQGLDQLGFQYIEVGHGLGLGAWNQKKCGLSAENDHTYITAAKEAAPNANIVAFFIVGIGSEDDIRAAKDSGLDFLRIGTNIHTFKNTLPYVKLAKELGLTVAVNLMKSYAVKPYEYSKIVQEIDSWNLADAIYLVDSAGCMFPHEVHEYIDRATQNVTTPMGFHGHNNLSLGAANSIQAIKSGARFVDTCIRGMGRSAGNAQTEIVIYLLSRLGIDLGIDLYKLYEMADNVVLPLMPRLQGLSSEEVHIGVSKFHSSFMPFVNEAVEKFGVDKKVLIKNVSDINCLNPTLELFNEVAQSISKK